MLLSERIFNQRLQLTKGFSVLNCDLRLRKRHQFLLTTLLERETGIEPATNSLEGCDSTTELLPPCLPSGIWKAVTLIKAKALTYRYSRQTYPSALSNQSRI